jgi:hypothetical protein
VVQVAKEVLQAMKITKLITFATTALAFLLALGLIDRAMGLISHSANAATIFFDPVLFISG